jgi:hypothetical protein
VEYEKQIKEILDASKEDIVRQTKEALKEKIMSAIDWQITSLISEAVKVCLKESLEEEIKQAVMDSKQEVINSIAPIFASAGAELAKAMQKKIVETFSDSWKANQIFKQMFGQ